MYICCTAEGLLFPATLLLYSATNITRFVVPTLGTDFGEEAL